MNETPVVIRPMTLGEILDKAIRLYRQNFLKFIGIYAIPYIPLVLVQMVVSVLSTSTLFRTNFQSNPDPSELMSLGLATLAGLLIFVIGNFIFVGGFATAALTRAVANNYMDKPIGILDSYRAISKSVWKLILALFLAFFLLILLVIWAFIPIIGWLSGPGIVMFLSLIVLPLVAPVASLGNLGVGGTIRRAWDMGRSRFWWLMGFAIVLALLGQLIVTGPVYLMGAIVQGGLAALPDLSFELQSVLNTIASSLFTLALGLLYQPLHLTVMTIVYFDLRARNEGLDLALQLAPTEESAHDDSAPLPEISNTTSMPLISGIDIGRFALLSLIALALFACYFAFIFSLIGLAGTGF